MPSLAKQKPRPVIFSVFVSESERAYVKMTILLERNRSERLEVHVTVVRAIRPNLNDSKSLASSSSSLKDEPASDLELNCVAIERLKDHQIGRF